jgi:hypothetical protein
MHARLAGPVLLSIHMALMVGCAGGSGSEVPSAAPARPRDLQTVRDVQERFGDEIRRRFDPTGFGIGAVKGLKVRPDPEDKVYVLVVYLRRKRDKPDGAQQIGGVPIRFEVAGPFRAQ